MSVGYQYPTSLPTTWAGLFLLRFESHIVSLAIPRRYTPGIVRLTFQISSQLVGIHFQLGLLSASVIIFLLDFSTHIKAIIKHIWTTGVNKPFAARDCSQSRFIGVG